MTAPDTTTDEQFDDAVEPKTYLVTKTVLIKAENLERAAKIGRHTRVPSRFLEDVLDIRDAITEVASAESLKELEG